MPIENNKSIHLFYIDVARFIAILTVILNHAVNRSYDLYSYNDLHSLDYFELILISFLQVLSRVGVPFFLMISGSLLLNRDYSGDNLKEYLKHNFLPLLICTEIWSSLYFIGFQFFSDSSYHIYGIHITLLKFIKNLLFINLIVPIKYGFLWYMYMILPVYLMIPLLSFGVRKLSKKYILLIICICIFLEELIPNFNQIINANNMINTQVSAFNSNDLLSHYYIYLLFGYLISNNYLSSIKKSWLIICIIVFSVLTVCYQIYIFNSSISFPIDETNLLMTIMILFLFELLHRFIQNNEKKSVTKSLIEYVSNISFAIYLFHMAIMDPLNWILDINNISHIYSVVILFVVTILITVGILYFLIQIKFLRKYLFNIKN